MGDASEAAAGDRSGERLEEREAAPTRRGGRNRGGQGQGRGKRARSTPGAGGGRGQEPPPRALPARKWMMYAPPRQETAADAKDAPVVANTFRVLSFNVLADYIVQRDRENENAKREAKYDWEYRRGRLVKEISAWAAHVVCLQEVDHFEDFFEPELKRRGYIGVYKQRTGAETLDGCAIFVKKSMFRILASHPVEYFRSEDDPVLNRHNVALALVVALKTAPTVPLIIANTHLLFNPGRGEIKLAQVQMLLSELATLRSPITESEDESADQEHDVSPSLPVILCGDFNMAPHSALYHFVAEGELDASGLSRYYLSGQTSAPDDSIQRALFINENDRTRHFGHGTAPGKFNAAKARRSDFRTFAVDSSPVTHDLELSSAYAQLPTPQSTGEPKFTTFHSGTKSTVDYIWYSRQSLHCHGVAEMTPAGVLFKQRELPTAHHPSDHLSLVANFSLRATHGSTVG